MNKNIKNKVLAFTMASAMIVPNVAVVFAEAPKAGLATVSKNATDEKAKTYSYKFKLLDNETGEEVASGDLPFTAAGDQTFDITPILSHYGVELADIPAYKDVDAAKFPFTVYEDGVGNAKDIFVTTKKEEAKTYSYKINLIDNETNENVASGDLSFNAAGDQTYDISSVLKHYGVELADIPAYKDVDATKFPFTVYEDGEGNTKDIFVSTKKEEAKTYSYKINLIDNETNEKVASGDLSFNAAGDQTYDISSVLKHYGVKLANLDAYKDVDATKFPFTVYEDGEGNTKDIFVTADTQRTTTLHINFITTDGTNVGEQTIEKTTDNDDDVVFGLGTDIILPAGYHWVDYNDQIKDVTLQAGFTGGHDMYVEQDETQTVLNVTFETKDGEVVGTTSAAKDFTVDEEGVKVANFVVGEDFDLPEGYHFAEDVDQVKTITVNGTVGGHTVIVEKDEEPAPTPSEDPKDDGKKDDTTTTPAPTATADAKKEEVKKASKTANTADSSNVAAYAIPLAMSMIAIGAIVVGKKKLS